MQDSVQDGVQDGVQWFVGWYLRVHVSHLGVVHQPGWGKPSF